MSVGQLLNINSFDLDWIKPQAYIYPLLMEDFRMESPRPRQYKKVIVLTANHTVYLYWAVGLILSHNRTASGIM